MNTRLLLRVTATGLALSSVVFAQSPPVAPTSPPAGPMASTPAAPMASPQIAMVTQSSRVRAFNAGPGGEVRSLYLQNGSVVDVTPELGGQLSPAVRKGTKITVTGTKSEINGQSLVEAASIRVSDQRFAATSPSAATPVPPPGGAPQPPVAPTSRRKNKAAASVPCAVSTDAPPPPPPQD